MPAKLKSIVVIVIILVSLIPLYWINAYLQKKMKPRQSFGRLFSFLLLALFLMFAYTFLIVTIIRKLFVEA
ncbi:MAG: hypothetical protein E6H09_07550 [Bacteroidetes bacterium]|nr:MAG: hypothetical protein E6H09_07550 [Bacteroidota bacterium]